MTKCYLLFTDFLLLFLFYFFKNIILRFTIILAYSTCKSMWVYHTTEIIFFFTFLLSRDVMIYTFTDLLLSILCPIFYVVSSLFYRSDQFWDPFYWSRTLHFSVTTNFQNIVIYVTKVLEDTWISYLFWLWGLPIVFHDRHFYFIFCYFATYISKYSKC